MKFNEKRHSRIGIGNDYLMDYIRRATRNANVKFANISLIKMYNEILRYGGDIKEGVIIFDNKTIYISSIGIRSKNHINIETHIFNEGTKRLSEMLHNERIDEFLLDVRE